MALDRGRRIEKGEVCFLCGCLQYTQLSFVYILPQFSPHLLLCLPNTKRVSCGFTQYFGIKIHLIKKTEVT